MKYERQVWENVTKEWQTQISDQDLWIAKHRDEPDYIYWAHGPDGQVYVDDDHFLYRIVEVQDKWIVKKFISYNGVEWKWVRAYNSCAEKPDHLINLMSSRIAWTKSMYQGRMYGIDLDGQAYRIEVE